MLDHQTMAATDSPERPAARRAGPARGRAASKNAPAASAYEQIAARLLQMERPAAPWLIGITSAVHGEGKTALSGELARVLARSLPEPVALVELDFARPTLAAAYRGPASPGLAEVVEQGTPLEHAARPTELPNLTIVPAGHRRGEPLRLAHDLVQRRFGPLFHQLASIVVCDLPPILTNPEGALLAREMGTVVVAVSAGATPAELVKQAVAQLDRSRIAGAVLIGEEHRTPGWLRRLLGKS